MANPVLTFNPPFLGMSAIVNVANRVGPQEMNSPADVRLVQRLIRMGAAGSQVGARIGVPAASGSYDAATGFWIYHMQTTQRSAHPQQIVDGVVSPARGAMYSRSDTWAIILFNLLAKNSGEYAAFLASGGTT